MNEQEEYWSSVLVELDKITEPLKVGESIPADLPPWVAKLLCELWNLSQPKSPMKLGMKATPKLIGRALGSQFANLAQSKQFQANAASVQPEVRPGLNVAYASAMPHFDVQAAMRNSERNSAAVELGWRQFLLRVLEERPLNEVAEFYEGFSTGLRNLNDSLMPEFVNGVPRLTPKQIRRIRSISVYWITYLNWKEIDRLQSSKEAFEFLAARMPEQMLGYDQERLRKMFYRVGKKFKRAGRPVEKRR